MDNGSPDSLAISVSVSAGRSRSKQPSTAKSLLDTLCPGKAPLPATTATPSGQDRLPLNGRVLLPPLLDALSAIAEINAADAEGPL
ncbi:hypothetical protein GCM10023191_047320 [Actinoallomurus oryzae]|uniref:FXSXX-COOH protein n=1 Tax=Actinoallomurus oryzae TaxID=502180 RepID=A0ABP8QAF4_9ACTN